MPSDNCTCGVYAFWSVEELLNQYPDLARRIVAVVRMDGLTIEGDTGVKAHAAQIVAWWCAEDAAELASGVCGQRSRHAPVLRPGRDDRPLPNESPEEEEPRWVTSGNRGAES